MVKSLIASDRPFSSHFIRELHQLITRTQEFSDSRTASGQRVQTELQHGAFRTLRAQRVCLDGVVRTYTPPEQIHSEMDRLVEGLELVNSESVPIIAAWLHHRFTQIHPFQDGNGRVARTLANMVFIKANLFPLMTSRNDREQYIHALDSADHGNLSPLIDLFAGIEAQTLLQALSIAKDEEERGRTSALDSVVDHLVSKVGRRIKDRESALRGVNEIALALRNRGRSYLAEQAENTRKRLEEADLNLRVLSDAGGPDLGTNHYWRLQLVDIARELDYWIDFDEDQYWFRVTLRGAALQLRFVVSLHHVGHELTGVVRAVAFGEVESQTPLEADSRKGTVATLGEKKFFTCTATVFGTTWQANMEEVWPEFQGWIQESFAVALRRWADLL